MTVLKICHVKRDLIGPFLLQKRGSVGIIGDGEVIFTITEAPNNALLK